LEAPLSGRAPSTGCAGTNMRNLTRLAQLKRSRALSYLFAALVVASAVIVALLLQTYLHTSPVASLFLSAVIFAAWIGGAGPGLAATALSILALDYFFIDPIFSLDLMLKDVPRLALFTLPALFVVGLIAAQRNATHSLQRSRIDMEDKVRRLVTLNAALQAESAERQRAEHGYREIERELQATIDTIPALVASYEPGGLCDFVNRPWRDYTGLSQDEAKGKTWATTAPPDELAAGAGERQRFAIIPHPADRRASEAEWNIRLARREPFQAQMRLRRHDGVYRWHMVHRVPLSDHSGSVVKWYSVAFDIEDRKRAEDALRQSEAYLAEAQRLSHTGSFGWNVASGEILWSEESYRIFEYDSSIRVTLEIVLNRVHPDDAALVRQVIDRAKAHKEAYDFEHRLLMPDGSVKRLNVVAHPLIDDAGDFRFAGAVMDITARKKAEEALRNSEQRYRNLFQYMPIALWKLNASELIAIFKQLQTEGVTELAAYVARHPHFGRKLMDAVKIEEVNERAVAMMGACDASEILGPLTPFCSIHEDAFVRGLGSRWRGEPTHQEESKLLTVDGRIIDVLMSVTRPGLDTDPGLSVLCLIDITERVQAREMLQRVQSDFAHAARVSMLGELTASIAHEVNQPLAAISTNGEVGLRLLDSPAPDLTELRELTTCVISDARRAAGVIARVRTMATRQAPEQTLLSIDEVIHEVLLFLRHEVQSHGLVVTHHASPSAPKVLGDRTQLQQVLVNLTVNAIQAMAQMEAWRRKLVIRTKLPDPRTLCCTVEDSGPGIKREHLDHLFDSFFTTKNAGMGLGLAISRSIIEAHGGNMRADNGSACGGARFSFTLPAKPQ
jgi:PAS domain S-box-containing protein